MTEPHTIMAFQTLSANGLSWPRPPTSALVVKKVHDEAVISPFISLVEWLKNRCLTVFVESSVFRDPFLIGNSNFKKVKGDLKLLGESTGSNTNKIDFIICLGGDGTLLHASTLFQGPVPPVMAFRLGSLGFLSPFEFDNFEEKISRVLDGDACLSLRSRLSCVVMSETQDQNEIIAHKTITNIVILNEVVIDRGPSPYLSNLDLYMDNKLVTSVQGDGLIISTPTGSTAYALAAGASMIHPSVPAILVTPICPHSLSFRPIVVPAGVELKICLSSGSRNTAWISFDGRKRQELGHNDSLHVTTSIYPVPSICPKEQQISDWFSSLAECLHWNVRKKQRQFDDSQMFNGIDQDFTEKINDPSKCQ